MSVPPSFPSFPSFSTFPDFDQEPSTSKKTSYEDTKKREKKEKKRRLSKERANRRQADEELKAGEDRQRRQDEEGIAFLFVSDRKGDPLNITYGGLHERSIPRYVRSGYGKVIGLGDAWEVVKGSGKGVEISIRGKRPTPRYSHPHALSKHPRRLLKPLSTNDPRDNIDEGFIALPVKLKPELDAPSYRAIEKPPASGSSASDSEQSSSSDPNTITLTSLQETLKSLDAEVFNEPRSIEKWLAILHHTTSTVPNITKAKAEIGLSVLDRALSAHPDNRLSVRLRLLYLKTGEEFWDTDKSMSEWRGTLKDLGDCGSSVWMAWIGWRMRTSTNIEHIIDDARRSFEALRGDEEGQIRILWRVAVYLREAGYFERAMAIFQAQVELTYFCPPSLANASFDRIMEGLEVFWESETPRIGEPHATGWAQWEASGKLEGEETVASSQFKPMEVDDPFQSWAAAEQSLDDIGRIPTRTFSTGETDPYSTILFSDINRLLLPLTLSKSGDLLFLAWLAFLGLHVPGLVYHHQDEESNCDDVWASLAPAPSGLFPPNSALMPHSWDSHAGVSGSNQRADKSGCGPVKDWGFDARGPLEGVGDTGIGRMWEVSDMVGIDVAFVRNVFSQIRGVLTSPECDLMALAFEAAQSIKGALKLSRSFLSHTQDSLLLWGAHARLERLRNRKEDARKIYRLNLLASSPHGRPDEGELWWDFAELEWLEGKDHEALGVISQAAAIAGNLTAVAALKAKRALEERIHQNEKGCREWRSWVKIRALLDLLISSSPSTTLSILDLYLATLAPGTSQHEALCADTCLMIYHHSARAAVPPAVLRNRLEEVIRWYPRNTLLLGMFIEGERGESVWGRVRKLLDEDSGNKGILRRIWEVWAEAWDVKRWESERVRSILAKAVRDPRSRGSPTIWKIYLQFEIYVGQLSRAKSLTLRAIGKCPWVKELYLFAFGPLRSVFTPRELTEVAGVMVERGLRTRQGLDEYLGEGIDHQLEKQEEEVGSEDEIEAEARERRKLMPY